MEFELGLGRRILERTPRVLDALLRGQPPEWTSGNEGPDTWSPYDVVGHLVHADRTDWIPRARVILDQGADRRFPPFDRFGQFAASRGKSLEQLLDEFIAVRAECVASLDAWQLGDAELALQGVHPEFGEVTLRQLLATWVAHDLSHLTQVTRVMAKQYRDAVGPWTKYLSVMGASR